MNRNLYGKICPLCQAPLIGNDYQVDPAEYRFAMCCTGCYKSNAILIDTRPELPWGEYLDMGYDQAISGLGAADAVPVIVI